MTHKEMKVMSSNNNSTRAQRFIIRHKFNTIDFFRWLRTGVATIKNTIRKITNNPVAYPLFTIILFVSQMAHAENKEPHAPVSQSALISDSFAEQPFPADLVKYKARLFELTNKGEAKYDKEFLGSLKLLLKPQSQLDPRIFRRIMSGPAAEATFIVTPVTSFIHYGICQAHQCNTSNMSLLLEPKTKRMVGYLFDKCKPVWLGEPDDAEKAILKEKHLRAFHAPLAGDCDAHFKMDIQFPSRGKELSSNWLEKFFPSVTKCTPDSFYYDKNAQRSNNGVLGKLGYSPYKIDDYVARYRINENFHGLPATEIAIPSGTDSVYSVTVSSGVRVLSDAIHKKTGKRLQIYNQRFKATSGVAYLISEDKQKTSFVCFTFQG